MHRLLFITENHPPDRGGMAESCDRIVRHLASRGVGIELLHFDRHITRARLESGTHGRRLRWPANGDPAHAINCAWNRLRHEIDLDAITHVVAFGGTIPILAAPAFAAWMRRPLLTLLRGNELDAGLFEPRRRAVLDDALLRSDAVCTVTTEQAEKVALLHPSIRPRVIGNGIDLRLWQASDGDRARALEHRRDFGDKTVLGVFGHLKAKKGVPFFIEALQRSHVAERVHLLVAGEPDDETRARLEEVGATLLPSADRFSLISLYLACDFVVLPSHYDGFPNVLVEASALGVPVLASAVGGMRDFLIDGDTDGDKGLLFAPGDEHGCTAAIARAVTMTHEERQRMSSRAEASARSRCDAREEASRYLEVLIETEKTLCAERSSS